MASGFGGMCCVYDDEKWLTTMVEGCYPALEKLFFLVSRQPWNGQCGSNERTLAAIRSCHDPENKISVIEGEWTNEAAQRNVGLEVCARHGLSFCLVIDADEIYDPAVLDTLMEIARLQTAADAWSIAQITYWKSYRYRIDGTGHNGQLAIVRIGDVRFKSIRYTTAKRLAYLPKPLGVCHHLSYARTDEEVVKKLSHSSHAPSIRRRWFDDVWRHWDIDPTIENLHPVRPPWFPRAVLQDPRAYPPALKRLYDRDVATHGLPWDGRPSGAAAEGAVAAPTQIARVRVQGQPE